MNRKLILTGGLLAVGLVVATTAVGPGLIRGQRFERAFKQELARSDGDAPDLSPTCVHCHGAAGAAQNSRYAALAGQPAAYLEAQLQAFADGRRSSPQMGPLAASLTSAQIKELAAYYARQAPQPSEAVAQDAALQRRGEAVVTARGCAGCHGERLVGTPAAPRLAGQGEAYVADQLAAFQHGARKDPTGAMNSLAGQLSAAEIQAAAHYVAGLSPQAAR